ncbi:MAG: BglII/BstYI family type II restriction endonuclease [Candidatus Limnocylindria bacterium]
MEFIPDDIRRLYEVKEWRNASAILAGRHEEEWGNILEVLRAFRLKRSYIVKGGGGRSDVPRLVDGHLARLGWQKRRFETRITVDEQSYDSPTHEVDMFKGRVAVEVEWNNKTEFYDRDLNNFRLLFDLRVIDVGVIITPSDELRGILTSLGIWKKYGTSSTNVGKLYPRLEGGGGGGCPVLVFAITKALYLKDE